MKTPSQSEQADTLAAPSTLSVPRGQGEPRYDVRELLARGGQSEVYVAFDRDLGREVAFKRPRPDARGAVPPALEARFLREARINARLDHPNVITVHEIGRDAAGLFCTQRLVRSGDGGPPKNFAQALAATQSLSQRLALLPRFLDVCTGVAHAHGRGIAHRDLKPDNVVLGGPNETVVLDWGLARDVNQPDDAPATGSGETLQTIDGQVFGTPLYMSPEQAFGQRDLVDARSDVWSLGIMLFELLTGRTPFTGVTPAAVIEDVRHGLIPSPRSLTPAAPPALGAVVMRALSRDRAARYPSAGELAAEVRAFLENRQVEVYDYSFVELSRLFLQRYRTTALVGGVALVLLLGALGALGLSAARARASLAEAFVEKARLADSSLRWGEAAIWYAAALEQSAREDAALGFQLVAQRAASRPVTRLQGHHLGVRALAIGKGGLLASAGTEGLIRVWDWERGLTLRELRGHTESVTGLAFSPDGQHLFSVSEDHTLRRWPVAAGEGQVLATLPDTLNAVVVSPDGAAVFVACELGQIFLVPAGGGEPRLFGAHQRPVYALALSPDGAQLASGSWSGDLKRWQVSDGALLETNTVHMGSVLALAWSPNGRLLASAGKDTAVRVWGFANGALTQQQHLSGHAQRVYGLAWDESSALLASVSSDGTSRVWWAPTGVPLRSMSLGESDELAAVRFVTHAQGGTALVWGGRSGLISLRAVEVPSAATTHLLAHALDRLPSRQLVMPLDNAFALFDPKTLERVFTSPVLHDVIGATSPMGELGVSARGRFLAGSCGVNCIAFWDLTAQRLLGRTTGHGGNEGLAFSPDEKLLATVGRDSLVRIWDVETRQVLRTLSAHHDGSYGVAWSPDGRWLATSGYDKHIILWETAGFTEVRRMEGHEHGVRSVTFSPDSGRLASAGWDRSARIWDIATGRELWRFHHQDFVFGIDFRPDGKALATASHDGTVRLWNLETGRELRFLSDESQASAVRFSADGRALFYAGRSVHRIDLVATGERPTLEQLLQRSGLRLDGMNLSALEGKESTRQNGDQPGHAGE